MKLAVQSNLNLDPSLIFLAEVLLAHCQTMEKQFAISKTKSKNDLNG